MGGGGLRLGCETKTCRQTETFGLFRDSGGDEGQVFFPDGREGAWAVWEARRGVPWVAEKNEVSIVIDLVSVRVVVELLPEDSCVGAKYYGRSWKVRSCTWEHACQWIPGAL